MGNFFSFLPWSTSLKRRAGRRGPKISSAMTDEEANSSSFVPKSIKVGETYWKMKGLVQKRKQKGEMRELESERRKRRPYHFHHIHLQSEYKDVSPLPICSSVCGHVC